MTDSSMIYTCLKACLRNRGQILTAYAEVFLLVVISLVIADQSYSIMVVASYAVVLAMVISPQLTLLHRYLTRSFCYILLMQISGARKFIVRWC